MKRVITFGTFDLFHVGHLNILNRAKSLGDFLIVGVSSDALNFSKKSIYPICSEKERSIVVQNIKAVDEVFYEESLELKRESFSNQHIKINFPHVSEFIIEDIKKSLSFYKKNNKETPSC